jgi:hypothetical protein
MINAVFGARYHVADALLIYHDFRQDPASAQIDTERAIESVGYHCLKNSAIPTGLYTRRRHSRISAMAACCGHRGGRVKPAARSARRFAWIRR